VSKGRNKLGHVQRTTGFASDYEAAEEATRLPQTVVEAELIRGDPEKGKRFRKGQTHIVKKPHLDSLLGLAYSTLWAELKQLEEQTQTRKLEDAEIRRYTALVDALSKLARTEKEANKDETEDLTEEELRKRAQEALKVLGK
jgi:hypothetical protein